MKQIIALAIMLLMAVTGRANDDAAQRRVATMLYARAIHEAELEHHDAVYDLLRHVLRLVPDHSAAMFRLSTYEMFLRHDSLAWDYLTRSVELDPKNPDYLEALTTFAERHDSLDLAIESCERLARLQPNRTEVTVQLCQLYLKAGQSEDAIDALTRIETMEGNSREIALSKYKIYMEQLEDTAAAFGTLYRLVKDFPADVQHRVILAEKYIVDRPEALADSARLLLSEAALEDPGNATLRMAQLHLAERYDSTGYAHLRDSLLYAPGTADELRRNLLVEQMRRGVGDSLGCIGVEQMFDRLTATMPDNMGVWSAKLVFRQATKQPTDSLIVPLLQMRRIEPDNRMALVTMMQCYAQKDDYVSLAALCDEAVGYYPDTYDFYYWGGMARYQLEDKPGALERFTQAVHQMNADTDARTAARLYATQGDLLHDAGRVAEAFAAYDSCLALDPDNVLCLNNYAYYLSLMGRDLQRAEDMSYRTLRLAPDSRTYIDTYAWILFQQADYGGAREYIDRAVAGAATPEEMDSLELSADVAAHAGDIYACQGDIEGAVRYWQLALEMKPEDSGAALLRRKIKKRKYIKTKK